MLGEKLANQRSLVDAQIIENDMDRLILRAAGDDFGKKSDELDTGVTRSSLSDDIAGLRIQRREQGKRPVTEVFKPVTLGAAR